MRLRGADFFGTEDDDEDENENDFITTAKLKGPGSFPDPGPCHFNKEQTPLGDLLDPNPRFHGGCFGV